MRTLKFRAWSKKHNRYLKLSGLHYDGDKLDGVFVVESIIGGIPNIICLEPEDVVIEQDTGLKDNNGKEIYDGDIVKVEKRFDAIAVGYDAGGFVLHNEDWDCVIPMNRGEYDGLGIGLGDKCTTVEVIGNIHENKELLKGEE